MGLAHRGCSIHVSCHCCYTERIKSDHSLSGAFGNSLPLCGPHTSHLRNIQFSCSELARPQHLVHGHPVPFGSLTGCLGEVRTVCGLPPGGRSSQEGPSRSCPSLGLDTPLLLGFQTLTGEAHWPTPPPSAQAYTSLSGTGLSQHCQPSPPSPGGFYSLYPKSHRSPSPVTSTEDCLLEANDFSQSGFTLPL